MNMEIVYVPYVHKREAWMIVKFIRGFVEGK